MNWKGKIVIGLTALSLGGGFFCLVSFASNEGHTSLSRDIAGGASLFILFFGVAIITLLWMWCEEKFSASSTPHQTSTPKIDFRMPPKDLFEYGKDVELPEKKEEPRFINPWQKRVTAEDNN